MEGYHVKFYRLNIVELADSTVQKYVDSPLQVSILNAIRDSWFLHESRIENREQAIGNRVEDWVSHDRKQKIHPWLISR